GGPQGAGHGRDRPSRREIADHQRLLGLGPGQHLDRYFGHRGEGAPGARDQLAEVVAGDVLHHPAAGLEGFAAAGHRAEAEEMVASGRGTEPARTGNVSRQRAADRAAAGDAAEDAGIVYGLGGELLPVAGPERFDPPDPPPALSP